MHTAAIPAAGLTVLLGLASYGALAVAGIETLTVNSTADSTGPGTLRQAIVDANNSVADEVHVVFDLSANAVISVMSDLGVIQHDNIRFVPAGPDRNITIDGNGTARLLVHAAGSDGTIHVSDLILRDGRFDGTGGSGGGGACLFTQGSVVLVDVTFTQCTAINASGGALRASSGASISGSRFINNRVFHDGTEGGTDGGGAHIEGTSCTITDTLFLDNSVLTQLSGQTGRSGGALRASCTEMTIEHSIFQGNLAESRGGGAILWLTGSGATATIHDNLFRDNRATIGGDPLFGPEGGALYIQSIDDSQSVQLLRNSFQGNQADVRAAALRVSTVSQIELIGNVFIENEIIDNAFGDASVNLFGNSSNPVTAALDFNTFTANHEWTRLLQTENSAHVEISRLHGNIFDQRHPGLSACAVQGGGPLSAQSGQFNVVTDESCTQGIEGGSVLNTDTDLTAPVSRPDRTLIYPKAESPAIDLITDESQVGCSGTTDLGGTVRPLDGDGDDIARCDAGALERNVWLFTDRFES